MKEVVSVLVEVWDEALNHVSPTFLWQRTTPVVASLADRTW